MRTLRRIVVGALFVVALVVILWHVGGRAFTAELESFAEGWLSRELRTSVTIAHAEISLVPLRATVEGFDVGEKGKALHVGRATLRLLPYSSLLQLRPVVDVAADDLSLDPRAFTAASASDEDPDVELRVPPVRLRDLRVTNARVLVPYDGDVIEVQATSIQGSAGAGVLPRRLRGQAGAAGVVVRRGTHELRVEQLQVEAAQTLRGLAVRHLNVQSNNLTVTVRQLRGGARLLHEVHAELALGPLGLLVEELVGAEGRLECDVRLVGSLLDPDGDGTVAASDVVLSGHPLGEMQAQLSKQGDTVDVTSLQGRAFGGAVTASGRVSLSDELGFAGKASWSGVVVSDVAAVFGARWADASSAGMAEVQGTVRPLTFHGRADGTLGLREPAVPVGWQATAEYEGPGGRLAVTAAQAEVNRLEAEVTVGADEQLSGMLEVSVRDTAAFTAAFAERDVPAVTGRLSAAGRLSGTVRAPVFAGTVEGERLQGVGLAADRVAGQLVADPQAIRVDRFHVQVGDGQIALQGTVALTSEGENDFTVGVSALDASRVLTAARAVAGVEVPVVTGLLSLNLAGREPWSRVVLTGDLKLEDFQFGEEPFESLVVEGKVGWPEWDGTVRLSRNAAERLTLSGRGTSLRETAVSLEARDWSLDGWLDPWLGGVRGVVSVSADLRGAPVTLTGDVALTGSGIAWRDHLLGDVQLRGRATRGRWAVDGSFLDGGARLDGEVRSLPELPGALRLSWQNARFTPLLGTDLDADLTSTGLLAVEGRLLRARSLKGQLRIATLVIAGHRYEVAATEPIVARLSENELQIEALRLEGQRTEIEMTGGMTLDGAVELRVRGQADLRVAEDMLDEIRSARGRLRLDVEVDRAVSGEFELAGNASLDKGLLDVGLPIVFTDTEAQIAFSNGSVHIQTLEGRAGGGRFSVSGVVDPAEGPAIAWNVAEMSPGVPDWLEQEISGEGTVEGTWRDLTVRGEVEVLRVLYDRPVRLVDMIPWFTRRVAPPSAGEPSDRVVRLDLHIVAPGQIFIDNNFAKIELRADLRVKGPADKVKLDGPIEVVSGQVLLQDRVFEITSGVVEFDPQRGWEAALNVDAETTVKTPDATYTVYGQLIGTTADYRVLLSSDDPSLSQADLASLVTLGRTTAQLQQGQGGISVNDLLLLGGGLKSDVEEGFRQTLFVDRFEIEPTFSQTTGAFEPRISVGKNLTENLTALVGTTVGAETQYRGELEYQLTRRISLLGSWESETEDQAGAFGGLVKFKYPFRRLPRFGLLGARDESAADAR